MLAASGLDDEEFELAEIALLKSREDSFVDPERQRLSLHISSLFRGECAGESEGTRERRKVMDMATRESKLMLTVAFTPSPDGPCSCQTCQREGAINDV